MKGIVSVLAVLTLAGAAFAQTQVYTPAGSDPTVPTFMNAEVVRVDPSGRTITIRTEGRDAVLSVEGEGLMSLSRLHSGDQVMLGYRLDSGLGTRVVTNIREVTPAPAGTTGAASRSTTIESVRVVAVNPSKRTLTVADGTGARRVVSVTPAVAKSLRQVRAGDDVVLSYRAGKGGTRTVTRVEPVGVSAGGAVTQVGVAAPVTPVVNSTTATTAPAVLVTQPAAPAATGGIPLPPNYPGGPAVLQPVPNVGPPTSPTLNVALPPETAPGVRDLQAATSLLCLKANEIDSLWFGFKDFCLGGTTPPGAATTTGREWFVLRGGNNIQQPSDDSCRQRLADIARAADLFQQQMDIALDAARKADLPPGTIREILQRNRLDR
jgi:hypothetical protein